MADAGVQTEISKGEPQTAGPIETIISRGPSRLKIETEADSKAALEALGYSGSLKWYQQDDLYGGADRVLEGEINGLWIRIQSGTKPNGQGVQTDRWVAAVPRPSREVRIGVQAYDDETASTLWSKLVGYSYMDRKLHRNQDIFEITRNIPGIHDPKASDGLRDKLLADERLTGREVAAK